MIAPQTSRRGEMPRLVRASWPPRRWQSPCTEQPLFARNAGAHENVGQVAYAFTAATKGACHGESWCFVADSRRSTLEPSLFCPPPNRQGYAGSYVRAEPIPTGCRIARNL